MRVIETAAVFSEWDPLLSLRGLAAYSCLSRRTLQNLLSDPTNPIPSYRVGGKILVRKSEFDRWLARHRNTKPQAAARLAAAGAQALPQARPKK